MTVQQAIESANNIRQGHQSTDDDMIAWLTELDQNLYNDIVLTHADAEGTTKPTYTNSNTGTTLIAEAPYDVLYTYWLMTKIDLYAQELSKYNNSLALYENAYNNWERYYHQHHRHNRLPEIRVGAFW